MKKNETEGYVSEETMIPAGAWRRSKAFLADFVLTAALSTTIAAAMGGFSVLSVGVIHVLVLGAYCVGMESSSMMATFGKRLEGVEVLNKRYERITIGQAFMRYVFFLLSIILFFQGLLIIFSSEEKETLHDRLSGTSIMWTD